MKTQEEIEKLSEQEYSQGRTKSLSDKNAYVKGYTQCQKDMAKKYTEEDLHTILRLRKEWYSHTDKNVVRDFIQSLNKQEKN